MGCPARLGQVVKKGPVTGTVWTIPPRGTWIDADDAAELTEIIEDVWCFRVNCYLPMHTVLYLNPDFEQMRQKP